VEFLQLISDFDFFNQQHKFGFLKKGGARQIVKSHSRQIKAKYFKRQNSIHRVYPGFYEGGLLCVKK